MQITDADHNRCTVGNMRLLWRRVVQDYRCNACGGRLLTKSTFEARPYRYYVQCFECGAEDDVIHWRELKRQRLEAYEVAGALPEHLREAMGIETPECPSEYDYEPRDLSEARHIMNMDDWQEKGDVEVLDRLASVVHVTRATREKFERDLTDEERVELEQDSRLLYGEYTEI